MSGYEWQSALRYMTNVAGVESPEKSGIRTPPHGGREHRERCEPVDQPVLSRTRAATES